MVPHPSRIYRTLTHSPVHFLCLQLPVGLVENLERFFSGPNPNETPYLVVLIWLPLFFMASVFSTAATFVALLQTEKGHTPTLNSTLTPIRENLKTLCFASLIVGAVCSLGTLALLLPGIFFTALYIFVPHLVVSEPGLPVMVYLNRSTRLAKQSLMKTLLIVIAVLVISLSVYLVSERLGYLLETVVSDTSLHQLLLTTFKSTLVMLTGAVVDIFVGHYYLMIKDR